MSQSRARLHGGGGGIKQMRGQLSNGDNLNHFPCRATCIKESVKRSRPKNRPVFGVIVVDKAGQTNIGECIECVQMELDVLGSSRQSLP
jgi:hypothetical protein